MTNKQVLEKTRGFIRKKMEGEGATANHLYGKSLFLKDKMNTKTAQAMAQNRHEFLENYLKQFYVEWDGKK